MNNPKLRFKREDSTDYPEWKDTSLGKIGDVAMCKRILKEQTTENGDVPFFKISTFGGTPDAYISYQLFDDFRQIYRFPQKGAILISAAGTIGKTVRYNGEDAYYQDSNIVWLEHDDSVVDDFLYQFYQQVSWEGLEGSTIKRLYNKNLLETPISLPCLEEQQKIADFLSTVDEVIAQSEAEVQNLEQQKKAAMQKIFSQEVRFKREDGTDYPEWEEKPMSEVFTEIIEKNRPDLPVLSILQGQGTVFRDSSDRNIMYDKKSTVNYKAMKKGDFIIHLRTFEGGLECATLDGISSPAYKILRTDKLIPEAYKAYFRSRQFIEGRLAIAVTGVRDGKNIEMSTFWEILVPVACLEEQQKIADFLSAYDEAISYAKQELDKWKELKKGLLQQMFV